MMKRWNGSIVPAIGAIVPIVLVTAGLSSARADELRDLRANQQLLEQRLDQLAQAPAGAPAGGPVMIGSFPRSFVIPGTETSLRIGGQAQGDVTWYLHGSAVGGALGGQGGFNETYVDGGGGTGNLPAIPLQNQQAHSRSGEFDMSGKPSRIFLDARTPSPWGQVQAFVEFDFAASNTNTILNNNAGVTNGYIPRFRKGYATLGGLLVGQDKDYFGDGDADAEILDNGGQTGGAGHARVPQAVYTMALPYGMSIGGGIENPDSDFAGPFAGYQTDTNGIPTVANCAALATATGGALAAAATGLLPTTPITTNNVTNACTGSAAFFDAAQNTMPDIVGKWRVELPWGHLQISTVMRDITQNDGRFLNQSFIGYGGSISGNVNPFFGAAGPWKKDNITYQFVVGEGIGNMIANSGGAVASNFGGPLGITRVSPVFSSSPYTATTIAGVCGGALINCRQYYDSQVIGKTITAFGIRGSFQHWWTDTIRSNVAVSMNHSDMNTNVVGPATTNNKELFISHINTIWSPISAIDLGIEYQFGHRETVINVKGDEHIVQGMMKVKF